MIRKITSKDLNDVFNLISTLDHTDDFYCAYTSNDADTLKKELLTTIENETAYVAVIDNKLKGFVSYFQFNDAVKKYDISGPYIANHSTALATELLVQLRNDLGQATYHFSFRKNSSFYLKVMTEIKAEFKGYEYELMMDQYNFKRLGKPTFSVGLMTDEERPVVQEIHKATFPDAYLSSEQLVNRKDIYVYRLDEQVIGYGLISALRYMFVLEVFAIKEAFRHQGYGKQFLSAIFDKSFYKNKQTKIKLVIEAANEEDIKMYLDFGFRVKSINSSFHWK